MSKVYDQVEWSYLRDMMRKMGFNTWWVRLIMKCVTTVRYQIKVNHDVTNVITPSRGLRQERSKQIQGIKVSRRAPSVNHLLFADDSLLLMKVEDRSMKEVDQILKQYADCSGQVINKDKSASMFSKNTPREKRHATMQILNLNCEAKTEKYLGLPIYIGKSKSKTFAYLKDRIWRKIQGWKERMLSMAGKEILIKTVAQSVPIYAMACFDLTKSLCDQMSTIICKYWWSQMDKENRIRWISWDKLSLRKRDGGLGFRDLYAFNLAMLARQAWRILHNPSSLCARVLSAKYFLDGNILNAKGVCGMSYVWCSILKGVKLLKQGIIWRVGNGNNIDTWIDPRIPRGTTRRTMTHKG